MWRGVLRTDRRWGGERDDFLRVQVAHQPDAPAALTPHGQQSSGAMASLAWAHGLARVPAGTEAGEGTLVDWYPLADWLA